MTFRERRGNNSKLSIPKTAAGLLYQFSVRGKGGNLSVLEGLLEEMWDRGTNRVEWSDFTRLRAYWVIREEEQVEFDFYSGKGHWYRSKSMLFKNILGQVTTPMLQAGYTVSMRHDKRMTDPTESSTKYLPSIRDRDELLHRFLPNARKRS